MKKILLLSVTLGLTLMLSSLFAQTRYSSDDPRYAENVEKAAEAREQGDFKTCISCYEKAFKISDRSILSQLRWADCLYSDGQQEKAMEVLSSLAERDWEMVSYLTTEYEEFDAMIDRIGAEVMEDLIYEKAAESGLNLVLKAELDSIKEIDQRYRLMMDSVAEKYGENSPEMQALWTAQSEVDSTNEVRIREIIEKYGYPGVTQVGQLTSNAVFLVIQHGGLEIQKEYFPLLKKAAEEGELSPSSVALLEDRILIREKKPQIYGSQLYTHADGTLRFFPIQNIEKLNERRKEVGLGSIEEYAGFFDLEFSEDVVDKDFQ